MEKKTLTFYRIIDLFIFVVVNRLTKQCDSTIVYFTWKNNQCILHTRLLTIFDSHKQPSPTFTHTNTYYVVRILRIAIKLMDFERMPKQKHLALVAHFKHEQSGHINHHHNQQQQQQQHHQKQTNKKKNTKQNNIIAAENLVSTV